MQMFYTLLSLFTIIVVTAFLSLISLSVSLSHPHYRYPFSILTLVIYEYN